MPGRGEPCSSNGGELTSQKLDGAQQLRPVAAGELRRVTSSFLYIRALLVACTICTGFHLLYVRHRHHCKVSFRPLT